MKLHVLVMIAPVLFSFGCFGDSGGSEMASAEGIAVTDTIETSAVSITGLAWGGGSLWAVDAAEGGVMRIDTETGELQDSFGLQLPPSQRATGLAYSEKHQFVYVGTWDGGTNGYVFAYKPEGELVNSASMCGG
ncbi:MAG: hypothetical protein GF388_00395 [Candidatus Aegiribacteria sp.]|nr:hypothetical protein [Candidatus Aegiribacteria sp.]